MSDFINATQVCALVDISIYTLNMWYKFKELNPENEYAKMLPEFIRPDNSNLRLWQRNDVYALIEFKTKIPHGRNGVLGDVTQKYVRGKRSKSNAKKKPIDKAVVI